MDNGLTFLADLDIVPDANVDHGDSDEDGFTDCSFAFGVGKEWAYSKGCFAVAGVLGDEYARKEENGDEVSASSLFIGCNLYGTYKFNERIGLFGSLTAGFNISGDVEQDISGYGKHSADLESGDFRIAPRFGLVIEF
ncbi:MAG: hypothetical protein KBT11_03215 [Treponema sp.]|nr:hypothetical protein [Candidatus Treponema equifaecale]